ncbi:MAG: HdeD family acid-resistance protein [Mycetocola sp.]
MSDSQGNSTPVIDELGLSHLGGNVRQGIRVGLGLSGIAALIVGILLTFFPASSLTAVAILFGVYFLVTGVVYIGIGAFASGASGSTRALNIVLGVLLFIVGVVAIKNIEATLLVIVLMVGIGWIVEGVLAITVSGRSGSRAWSIIFGIISILAGIVVLFAPGLSLVTLALVGGISLIVIGIAQIIRAFTFGKGL